MIRGVVNGRNEAIVRLLIRGPGHSELEVDAVVDSGFTATLTLPASTVAALGLTQHLGGGALMADGTFLQLDVYSAEVEWEGEWRPVLVSVVGDETLMGMQLLAGHELRVAVVPGGPAEITRLP